MIRLTAELHLESCKNIYVQTRVFVSNLIVQSLPHHFSNFNGTCCQTLKGENNIDTDRIDFSGTCPSFVTIKKDKGFPRYNNHFFLPGHSELLLLFPFPLQCAPGKKTKYSICVCLLAITSTGPHSPRFRADAYPTWQPVANTAPG